MNKKNLPHIITVVSFVVFIVLGLACASSSEAVKNATSVDELVNLGDQFTWLKTNAQSGGEYVLEVYSDTRLSSFMTAFAVNLDYKDKNNITITLKGIGGKRTIRTVQNCGMFLVGSGVTLILDDNILLQGVTGDSMFGASSNDSLNPVVKVNSGGTLIMNDGSGIWDNMSFQNGGGVSVSRGGTFLMNGGTIAHNTCFQPSDAALSAATGGEANAFSERQRKGGGVYVEAGGTFTKTGGTITGYASDREAGNVTQSFNALSVSQDNGHAVYAESGSKRKETTAGPDANLQISSNGTFSGDWDF